MNQNTNTNEISEGISHIIKTYFEKKEIKFKDIKIDEEGKSFKEIIETIKYIGFKTPKVDEITYLSQLFSGVNQIGIIADMATCLFNSPMHTVKSSGINIEIEKEIIRYINNFIDFKDGIVCPGGTISNLVAMIIAKYRKDNNKNEGINKKYRIYTSEESHYSITKNSGIIGIGKNNVVKIKVDEEGVMDYNILEKEIINDITKGYSPLMIISTSGTTQLGSFDNLKKNDLIAKKYNLWHHVDGAFGGTNIFNDERKYLMDGIKNCDSLTIDIHKTLSAPISSSVLLMNNYDLKLLDEDAYYLFSDKEDLGRKSIQCARRNDALKMWAILSLGNNHIKSILNHQIKNTEYAYEILKNKENIEIGNKPTSPLLIFRHTQKDLYKILTEKGYICGKALYKNKEWVKISFINDKITKEKINNILKNII
jgi:sulfinoalanine decarboxylase